MYTLMRVWRLEFTSQLSTLPIGAKGGTMDERIIDLL